MQENALTLPMFILFGRVFLIAAIFLLHRSKGNEFKVS